jgi:hypothetical protein
MQKIGTVSAILAMLMFAMPASTATLVGRDVYPDPDGRGVYVRHARQHGDPCGS